MFMQLLVLTCACTLGVVWCEQSPPPYVQYHEQIHQAYNSLADNVLSMEGNIPLLNDSRRFYAEHVNVILHLGRSQGGCIPLELIDYFANYQPLINNSAPDGLANPQKVIAAIKQLHQELQQNYAEIMKLIKLVPEVLPSHVRNVVIDAIVQDNLDKYQKPQDVFVAAGKAAIEFNQIEGNIAASALHQSTNKDIINGVKALRPIVAAGTVLHNLLHCHKS